MDRKGMIFVAGTGTDLGKTYVAGLLVKRLHDMGMNSGYYKAAMSGNVRDERGRLIPGDAVFVKELSGIFQPVDEMCPYVYEKAYSPHLAARLEHRQIDMDVIAAGFEKVRGRYDFVTVEGSGGIVCPVRYEQGAEDIRLEDIIKTFGIPCIIVADAGLGTINHVALTAEYMRNRNMDVRGIILNRFHKGDVMEEDNMKMCEIYTGLEVLACVEENDRDIDISEEKIMQIYEEKRS